MKWYQNNSFTTSMVNLTPKDPNPLPLPPSKPPKPTNPLQVPSKRTKNLKKIKANK